MSDTVQNVYITDGTYIDEFVPLKLVNWDILRIVGKALNMGYKTFSVHRHTDHAKVVEFVPGGDIWINWDIVRKADDAEWDEILIN